MELYLIDLIKDPELKDSDLEEILRECPEKLFNIPDSEVPLIIGRSPYADIFINFLYSDRLINNGKIIESKVEYRIGQAISRFHCRLCNFGIYPYVEDLGSKNGTFVEGIPANITGGILLNDRDRLCLGPQVFKVLFPLQYKGVKNRANYFFDENTDFKNLDKNENLSSTKLFIEPCNENVLETKDFLIEEDKRDK